MGNEVKGRNEIGKSKKWEGQNEKANGKGTKKLEEQLSGKDSETRRKRNGK